MLVRAIRYIQLTIVICVTAAFVSAFAQDTRPPLTNADMIKLVRAKLPESTIILSIQSRPSAFDTSPEALISLKENGVSTKVIEAMLQAGVKPTATQASPSVPQGAAERGPAAPVLAGGITSLWGSKQSRIEVDRVFLLEGDKRTEMKYTKPGTRTRWVFSVQQFAVLGGLKSRLRTEKKSPEFEMILPNNVEVSSVLAFALLGERSNGTREILIGGGFLGISQGLPQDRNVRITYDKAADQSGAPEGYEIYRIKPAESLKPGEYAFMVHKPSGGEMGPLAGAGFNYNFYELGVD